MHRKTKIFLVILLFTHFLKQDFSALKAQNKVEIDTVFKYKVRLATTRMADSVIYKIDNKIVTKEKYDEIIKGHYASKKCNPCFLKLITPEGKLDSEGIFYYNCNLKDMDAVMFEMEGKKQVSVQSCKDGIWKTYKKNGKVKKVERFELGKKIKTKI